MPASNKPTNILPAAKQYTYGINEAWMGMPDTGFNTATELGQDTDTLDPYLF